MRTPSPWRPLASLCLAAVTVVACACAPHASRTLEPARTSNGLEPGGIYTLEMPVVAVIRGSRTSLVPPAPDLADSPEISAGTRIRVTGVREENTLTHGMESWPEGTILDGPQAGRSVSLGHRELPPLLRRTRP